LSNLKEDLSKQINEVKKSTQDLDKNVSNMEEKFSKEIEVMINNQVEMLEIKTSINLKEKAEERLSEMEDKIKEVLHANNYYKEKMYTYDYNT
jgi:TATA-box binding protein (TBP) (component of TFIID and TFIIIB)